MAEEETDLRVTKADFPDDFLDLEELRTFCAQKLTPRRRVEKKVPDFNRGAPRVGRGSHLGAHVRAAGLDHPALAALIVGIGRQLEFGHRGNTGECLAPETQGLDARQVAFATDLAGRMTRQRQRQVFGMNTGAVIGNPYQAHTASVDINRHPACACIQGVFEQFLDDRRGSLNDFAGRNLVSKPLIQQGDSFQMHFQEGGIFNF